MSEFIGGIIFGAVVATKLVMVIPDGFKTNDEIIKHGCGEYNSTTSLFQWKEKE